MQITAKFRKVCASVAVAGVAMLGLIPAAYADDSAGAATTLPSTVTATEGTLTIHKHEQPAAELTASTGKALAQTPDNPIKGVVFTVYKVENVDLTKNTGWEQAADLITKFKADPNTTLTLGDAQAFEPTGTNGEAKKTLPVGLYLVKETGVNNATKPDGTTKVNVVPAAPFLVTIPMVNPDDKTSWLYDIHVYPKNTPLTGTKTVADEKKNLGDKVEYTIQTDIPSIESDTLSKYVVIDQLPEGMSFLKEDGDITVSLTAGGTLAEGDYTISDANSNPVKVTFTAEGLKKLATAGKTTGGAKVKVVLKAKITEFKEAGYTNRVYFAPSTEYGEDPAGNNPPIKVPDEPVTKVGQIEITKFKQGDDNKSMLAGAKFKLAYCDAPTTFLTIGDASEWTTTTDKLVIKGLQLSNFYNGAAQTKLLEYCLFEVEAPQGYQLPPEPYKFTLTSEGNVAQAIDVPNVPENGGVKLPLTGSQALGILTAAGVFLVVGSFVLLGGRRRTTK